MKPMDEGISADEACRLGVLTPEDYSRLCNEDGSVKRPTQSTVMHLKDDTNSMKMSNTSLQSSFVGLVLFVLSLVLLILRRRNKR